MNALPEPYISLEEYYALEERATEKHEYYRGKMYAMTGGTATHSRIGGNVYASLHTQLRGKSCVPYNGDLRIKIDATDLQTYPDVSVICGPLQYADNRRDVVTNPAVIVEVLSPSTEKYDRGTKFHHYKQIPSLRAYLLISQDSMRVEYYTRQNEDEWLYKDYTRPEQAFDIDAIGIKLSLSDVYEGVEFEEEDAEK